MFSSKNLIAYILFAVILFPIIFSFTSNDLTIYLEAGKTIVEGKKIYVDFVDIKSPLFFTFYSLISFITSNSTQNFFILCFLVIWATSISIFHFVKSNFSYIIALLTGVIYSLSTLIVGFGLYIHFEVLFGFLLLLLIIAYSKTINFDKIDSSQSNHKLLLLLGFVVGIIISLKYSFALVYFSFLIYDYYIFKRNIKELLTRQVLLISTTLVTIALSHFWLLDREIFDGFINTFRVLKLYATTPEINVHLLRDIIKITGIFFGDQFSILFTVSTFIGILKIYEKRWTEKQKFLLTFSLLLIGILMLSIYWERKLIVYHFARIIIPISLLVAIGLKEIYDRIKNIWLFGNNFGISKFLLVGLVSFLIFIGPFARYIGILRFPYFSLKGKQEYYNFIDKQRPNFFNYSEKAKLVSFINQNYSSDASIFIVSIGSFDLINELKPRVYKKFPQRNFYLNSLANNSFFDEALKNFEKSDLIIIQKNDANFENITKSSKSSYQNIIENPQFNQVLRKNYIIVYNSPVYVVYQKIK